MNQLELLQESFQALAFQSFFNTFNGAAAGKPHVLGVLGQRRVGVRVDHHRPVQPAPRGGRRRARLRGRGGLRRPNQQNCNLFWQNFKFCKFLEGSFSAVSERNFARKYAFDSIFQALQDLHPFAPLESQVEKHNEKRPRK